MVEALGRVSASWRYMCLQGILFSGSLLNAQVAPTSGHACLTQGNRVTFDLPAHSGIAWFGVGIARALSSIQRGGSHRGETDSAANQFGVPESAKDPRGTISVVCGPCLPLAQLSDI